jgi:hypothetical protein
MAGDLNRGEHFARLHEDGTIMLEHNFGMARTAEKTSLPLLRVLSLPAKRRQFTQLLLGNGSTCDSILMLYSIIEQHLNLH